MRPVSSNMTAAPPPTGDVACGGEGDRLVAPFDVCEPASGRKVFGAHRHHECGRGAPERRQCAGRGDGVEDRRERVMLLLRPGAVVVPSR